ncbi:Cobyrinic acid ac-diamide synthase [Caenorhabditis elegans]|uniref:Cobyrinic acid ac-diamide synthase n=1 Tax=Caenorhabditis elegans TaxID=6239 RepID=O16650_CAEEL|nr:Cobyrinic acid ac-diamide synthase [Caenorhabditis elegans]CCD69654.1 Cobyrinic acid ac-diamide synthase [Caenorhabditis elegans]|eukprot:NP_494528.3 Uncharacterized protein CELE_T06D4.2 [Caenorhabditis elegans]
MFTVKPQWSNQNQINQKLFGEDKENKIHGQFECCEDVEAEIECAQALLQYPALQNPARQEPAHQNWLAKTRDHALNPMNGHWPLTLSHHIGLQIAQKRAHQRRQDLLTERATLLLESYEMEKKMRALETWGKQIFQTQASRRARSELINIKLRDIEDRIEEIELELMGQ